MNTAITELAAHPGLVWALVAVVLAAALKHSRRRHRRSRRAYTTNRRRRVAQPGREIPPWLRRRVYRRAGGLCYWCGTLTHYQHDGCDTCFEADHYYPYSLGGPTTAKNLVCACRRCNRMKSDDMPDVFLAKCGVAP